MCFSKNQSLSLFVLGGLVSLYVYNLKGSIDVYVPLFFFSLMELLQYFGYVAIETKNRTMNQIISFLIYAHIGIQPYFANMWFKNFIPSRNIPYIDFSMKLCIVFFLFWISRIYFWENNNKYLCDTINEPNCGLNTLLQKGPKHLLYLFKMRATNYITPSTFMHFFLFFMPALLLDVNITVYVTIILSALVGWFLSSDNIHEKASVWCFFATPFFILSLIFGRKFKK